MRASVLVPVAALSLLGGAGRVATADLGRAGGGAVTPVAAVMELFPVEPGANAERGFAVALDGDLLAVGAPLDDETGAKNAGAVYLFTWEDGSWEQKAKLFADPPQPDARFGSAVALEEEDGVLAVAALGKGTVYLFDDHPDGVWRQRQRLTGPAGQGGGVFGRSVALDGDLLAVGAVGPHGRGPGAVHLYSILGTEPWTSAPLRIAPAQPQPGERFGQAVALAGGLLVAGAPGHSAEGKSYVGAAYVFVFDGSGWVPLKKLLAPDRSAGDQLGAAVATDGFNVVLGAPTADRDDADRAGAVYGSTCHLGVCAEPERLASPAAVAGGQLGFTLALSEGVLVAGGPGDAREDSAGVIQVFRSGVPSTSGETVWLPDPLPLPSNAEERDLAGFAAGAGFGRVVVAGVLGDQGSASAGAVWSFALGEGEEWSEEGEAVARDPLWRPADPAAAERSGPSGEPPSFSLFGSSVAATEDFVAVGSRRESGDGGDSAGEVYVYRRAGRGFRQEVRLTSIAGLNAPDAFGAAVALDGASLLVGAPGGIGGPGAPTAYGAAYLFSRSAEPRPRWRLEEPIYWGGPGAGERLGASVAITDGVLAVGDPRPSSAGKVFVIERRDGEWVQVPFPESPDETQGDELGAALSLEGGLLAIGSPGAPHIEPEPDIPNSTWLGRKKVTAPAEATREGAVYLARRSAQGTWTISDRLEAPIVCGADDVVPVAGLGTAVALREGMLAAGAPAACGGRGALGLLQGVGGSQARGVELGSGPDNLLRLGAAVAVSAERLLAGAPGAADGIPAASGRLVVYEPIDGWLQTGEITAPHPLPGDLFGSAIALTDEFFVVTSPGASRGDRVTVFPLPAADEELEP